MTYALSNPEDYGRGNNLGLEDLYAEMTEEGLGPRTQEMDSGDDTIPHVPNDGDHVLFENCIEIDDTQQ